MQNVALPLVLAIIAGTLMAIQAPTNALLGKAAGSPVLAALISFLVGSVALAVYVLLSGRRVVPAEFHGLPWYVWLGGLYGAFFVAVAAFAAPRLGVGVLLVAVIAGQLAGAVLLDHFGLIGLERHPVNFIRLAGVGLVLVGAVLVWRSRPDPLLFRSRINGVEAALVRNEQIFALPPKSPQPTPFQKVRDRPSASLASCRPP